MSDTAVRGGAWPSPFTVVSVAAGVYVAYESARSVAAQLHWYARQYRVRRQLRQRLAASGQDGDRHHHHHDDHNGGGSGDGPVGLAAAAASSSSLLSAAGPPPLPLFGNSILLCTHGYYRTLYEHCVQRPRPAAVFWVGRSPFIVVSDEECVQRVLASEQYAKPRYFGYRSRAMRTALDMQRVRERLETSARARRTRGKTQRRGARSTVAPAERDLDDDGDGDDDDDDSGAKSDPSRRALLELIDRSMPAIRDASCALLASMSDESSSSSSLSDLEVVQRMYVKLNCQVLFALHLSDDEAARVARAISRAGDEFSQRMIAPLRGMYAWCANVRYWADIVTLIRFGRRLCRHLDATSGTWVHGWVGKAGRIGKLGKVLGLLMASTQTVPVSALWMLHLVARHPRVLARLRDEVLAQVGDDDDDDGDDEAFSIITTAAELRRLRYADCVVREALRMYPPFPILQRQAQEPDVIGDVYVPAGQIVSVVPWIMHHHCEYWAQPETFRPERFEPPSAAADDDGDDDGAGGADGEEARHGDAPSDYCYLPFGRGRRMCAGSPLALAELKSLLVCAVLQWGEWTTTTTTTTPIAMDGGDATDGVSFPPLSMKPPPSMRIRPSAASAVRAAERGPV